jgi:uncharacterized protein (DUF58 family)
MSKHEGKILLALAAIVAIGMARSYAGDVVTAGVVGFVAGVATILTLMSLSTRIAAKNPALALSAKERVKTEALKEREQIKAQLRAKPAQPQVQQPNENQQWLAQFEALR